ncbi:MAG: 2-dehydro-3-deoxygalactonokinase [Pseudomonadota bacterium]
MAEPGHIAAILVDWGTTNLRLWAINPQGRVIGAARGSEGMNTLSNSEFSSVFERYAAELGAHETTPAMICGMAGARDGWREANYVATPFRPDDLVSNTVHFQSGAREIAIMPGASFQHGNRFDVMRSEETQLAALISRGVTDGVICMPGTHSKWVDVRNGQIVSFSTSMTGELFSVLKSHSILRSLTTDAAFDETDPDFNTGLKTGLDTPDDLMTNLFALRARAMIERHAKMNMQAQLSGLLIGTDVASAVDRFPQTDTVHLVSSGHSTQLYRRALEAIGSSVQIHDGEELSRTGLFQAAHSIWPHHLCEPDNPKARQGALTADG